MDAFNQIVEVVFVPLSHFLELYCQFVDFIEFKWTVGSLCSHFSNVIGVFALSTKHLSTKLNVYVVLHIFNQPLLSIKHVGKLILDQFKVVERNAVAVFN